MDRDFRELELIHRRVHRYDNYILREKVSEMMELRKCPFKCGGVVQEDCMCSDEDCRQRMFVLCPVSGPIALVPEFMLMKPAS
jgi:hypothetical protein